MIERDQKPVLFGQVLHRSHHPRSLVSDKNALLRIHARRSNPLTEPDFIDNAVVDEHLLPDLPRPQLVSRRVRGYPIQPRGELGLALEAPRGPPDLDEHLRQRLLGILMIAKHPVEQAVNRTLVPSEKDAQSLLILSLAQFQESLVACREIVVPCPLQRQSPPVCLH